MPELKVEKEGNKQEAREETVSKSVRGERQSWYAKLSALQTYH